MKIEMDSKTIIVLGIILLGSIGFAISKTQGNLDNCLGCHESDLGLEKEFVHPFVKDGQCLKCHSEYDKNTHKESASPQLDICLGCHPSQKLGRSHPVGEGIVDPNTGTDMTCVSTCHFGHSSDYKYIVSFKNNMELCLSCHEDF